MPTRGSISSYNIAGLRPISEVSEEVATQIAKNCRRQQPHSHLRSPPRGTPRVSAYTLFPETSHWPTFLSLHVWVYLYSNLCSGVQKTHLFCTALRFGRSRSFRVIQGRWFWYQSKVCIRLFISPSLTLTSTTLPFSRCHIYVRLRNSVSISCTLRSHTVLDFCRHQWPWMTFNARFNLKCVRRTVC